MRITTGDAVAAGSRSAAQNTALHYSPMLVSGLAFGVGRSRCAFFPEGTL